MPTDQTVNVKILQVLHGDAIQIRYFGKDESYHNIFIDGGFVSTYKRTLREEVKRVINLGEKIDLFIITHTDNDHIKGVMKFVEEFGHLNLVEQYWFNHFDFFKVPEVVSSSEISISEGIQLRKYLKRRGERFNDVVIEGNCYSLHGAKITILSPDYADIESYAKLWAKAEFATNYESQIASGSSDYSQSISELSKKKFNEDKKLENRVSISFLFEIYGKKLLFLGDTHPSQIITALNKLGYSLNNKIKASCVKLSHHASKHNTNNELISLIDSDSYIVSANGKNRYGFPHKEPLSRILGHTNRNFKCKINFFFNYKNEIIQSIFLAKEEDEFNFYRVYPGANENGISIKI
ncbi:ribonuclease domain-containing protein [Desulfonema limicola]|uniref:Ribonuclease domain-containing protein n=1 Tax=Desulfonema limicola TaxID=45656 RepID=A0A975B6Q0_9BACT|nr:hypothetical protein [Desulfonema limicola]QTA79838.1 ribonuclease domain-containing protein [Desulfonema limicola]